MATNIPPHNLRETIDAVIAYIDDSDIEVPALMQHLKGPDFPTGGIILGYSGIKEAYETGRGRVRVRAKAHVEPIQQGKEAIIVTELPFMVKKGGDGGLIQKIADLVRDKRISEISDLRDESDRRGMRLVIELKRDVIPKVVLNKLYKHTAMQSTFGVNMVALVDGVPRTLGLKQVIHNYVQHQREVVVRRSKHELSELERRVHVLEGLLIALGNLDEVIALIRASRDRATARAQLVERFELTGVQAEAILQLRLSQLTALEVDELKQEHADKLERIGELRALLGDEDKVYALIKEELREVAERFGNEGKYLVFATRRGVVKKTEFQAYTTPIKADGIIAINIADDDELVAVRRTSGDDEVILVSRAGQAVRFEESKTRPMGRATGGVRGMDLQGADDAVLAMDVARDDQELLVVTENGYGKRTSIAEYRKTNRGTKGVGTIKLTERKGALAGALVVREHEELVFISENGMVQRTGVRGISRYGRLSQGVRLMILREADRVSAVALVAESEDDAVTAAEGGAAEVSADGAVDPAAPEDSELSDEGSPDP